MMHRPHGYTTVDSTLFRTHADSAEDDLQIRASASCDRVSSMMEEGKMIRRTRSRRALSKVSSGSNECKSRFRARPILASGREMIPDKYNPLESQLAEKHLRRDRAVRGLDLPETLSPKDGKRRDMHAVFVDDRIDNSFRYMRFENSPSTDADTILSTETDRESSVTQFMCLPSYDTEHDEENSVPATGLKSYHPHDRRAHATQDDKSRLCYTVLQRSNMNQLRHQKSKYRRKQVDEPQNHLSNDAGAFDVPRCDVYSKYPEELKPDDKLNNRVSSRKALQKGDMYAQGRSMLPAPPSPGKTLKYISEGGDYKLQSTQCRSGYNSPPIDHPKKAVRSKYYSLPRGKQKFNDQILATTRKHAASDFQKPSSTSKLSDILDTENFEIITSPSTLWMRMSNSLRFLTATLGFLLFYYALFAGQRSDDLLKSSVKEESNFSSPQSIALEPVKPWHSRANEHERVTLPPVEKPRNYMLESAMKAQQEAALLKLSMTTVPIKVKKSKRKISTEKGGRHMPSNLKPKSFVSSKGTAIPALTTAVTSAGPVIVTAAFGTIRSSAVPVLQVGESKDVPMTRVEKVSETMSSETGDLFNKGNVASGSVNASEANVGTGVVARDERADPGSGGRIRNEPVRLDGTDPANLANSHSLAGEVPAGYLDLDPNELPTNEVPILQWNYDKVLDRKTAKQIFALGGHDHVGVYKPFCIIPKSGKAVTFHEPRVCAGFNRTAGWILQYCSAVEESFEKENNVEKERLEIGEVEWLATKEASGQVEWIEGLTLFQVYEKSCGNIAHYAGRVLMLQHIIDNTDAYADRSKLIENIVIVPTFHLMKRFLNPQNYDFWHKSVLRAIVAPAELSFGTLGDFLRRERSETFQGIPRVELLHNLSLSNYSSNDDNVVCFRHAIVPGFWKSRFFADDREYPSEKPSLQSSLADAPRVPRDSLRFRERINALIHKSTNIKPTMRKIIFLDRDGSRRNIQPDDKTKLLRALEATATTRNFKFEVVNFAGKTFSEQVSSVEEACIAIGVHGANLVNAIFMPPLAVLIELFPYMFQHGMYEEGGGAGLKYYSYQMSSGTDFNAVSRYRSPEACIRTNHQCKVHYRDAELQFQPSDTSAMQSLLASAMDWFDSVESSQQPRNQ